MESPTRHILKSNDVKLEGRFRLDAGQDVLNSANEKKATSASAQIRIVENHSGFAVMEVICGCGVKTHIRCEYTNALSTDQELDPKNNGENNNAS